MTVFVSYFSRVFFYTILKEGEQNLIQDLAYTHEEQTYCAQKSRDKFDNTEKRTPRTLGLNQCTRSGEGQGQSNRHCKEYAQR